MRNIPVFITAIAENFSINEEFANNKFKNVEQGTRFIKILIKSKLKCLSPLN